MASSSACPDSFRILVATDLHVGYAEKDPVRFGDSVRAFEEVLQIAVDKHVDFVLLGGDLFHENKPSRDVVYAVTRLLRQYCFGDQPVQFELLSDPAVNFDHSQFATANYLDGNLNVSVPVFTVHGNHDDLSGRGLCALDPLHEAGLVNLFGKHTDVQDIQVTPILMQKGGSRLALYGIGAQRDDRLARELRDQRVKFLAPAEWKSGDYFSLLVLHQNRPRRSMARSTGAYVPEQFLPNFLDLVIWGHEHQCLIEPTQGAENSSFFVSQPGSTVATSLSEEEAGDKFVGLLTIRGSDFRMEKIRLDTPRQFYWAEVVLDTVTPKLKLPSSLQRRANEDEKDGTQDETCVHNKIKELLRKAERERRPKQPELPLIRVRVVYGGAWADVEPLSARRLGQQYADRLANPADCVLVKRVKPAGRRRADAHVDADKLADALGAAKQHAQATVEDIVKQYFKSAEDEGDASLDRLQLLYDRSLSEAVHDFVVKEDNGRIKDQLDDTLQHMHEALAKEIEKEPRAVEMTDEQLEELSAVCVQRIRNAAAAAGSKREPQSMT